jgi:membrane associated rhomboid family serine protease/Zn-finger nucleic acid-binding protein
VLTCPACRVALARLPAPAGVLWECPSCRGRVADLSALRKTPAGGFVRRLYMLASRTTASRDRTCAGCGQKMTEIPTISAPDMPGPLRLDVCTRCDLVWFDAREHEAWLAAPTEAAAAVNLPAETRQAMEASGVNKALWREMIDRRWAENRPGPPYEMEDGNFAWVSGNEIGWKIAWVLVGLPVEVKPPPLPSRPWATWSLTAVTVMVSIVGLAYAPGSITALGLVPADEWRDGGLTFFTSFFLHGSLLHLLGNIYFLLVFGDDVEDRLGRGWYLALVGLSALVGDLAHAAMKPFSTIPTIGASGGISGVMAFYALRFPRRRLRMAMGMRLANQWFGLPRLVDLSASSAMVLWVALQVIGMGIQSIAQGTDNVAYLAHLGGAVVGLVFWSYGRGADRPAAASVPRRGAGPR